MITYRKAEMEDLDILVSTHVESLREGKFLALDINKEEIENATKEYYKKHLSKEHHIEYLAFKGEEFVGCGSMSIHEGMPTFENLSGKRAYVMDLYVRRTYRRKGIGQNLINYLMEEAKKIEIPSIEIEASDADRQIYKRFGFQLSSTKMEYQICDFCVM